MNTIAYKSNSTQVFLTILFAIGFFIISTMQAHASSNSEAIVHMQGQLNVAEKKLTSMLAMFTPAPEVLGASTNLTAEQLEAQIAKIKSQINQMNGNLKIEGTSAKNAYASSTYGSHMKPLLPECRAVLSKDKRSASSEEASSETKNAKKEDCKGTELARLIVAKKEVDARIVELQAKSAQMKLRIAYLMSQKGSGSTTSKVKARVTPEVLGASTSDLQAQIDMLMAQIAALNGGTTGTQVIEEVVVTVSDQSPEASTIVVDSDTDTFNHVLVFTLDSNDSTRNIEVEQIGVHIKTSDAGGAADLINQACLVIKGVSFCETLFQKINSKDSVYWFNIGGGDDFVILPGEQVDVTLKVSFRPPQGNYKEGTTITASVKASEMSIDGSTDELVGKQLMGSATVTHTLRSKGLIVSLISSEEELDTNSDTTINDDEGTFKLVFEVTALETDAFIPLMAARGNTNATAGVNYKIQNNGATTSKGVSIAAISSDATRSGGYYVINEGETETFMLSVMFNPATAGSYLVGLLNLNWNDTASVPDTKTPFKPVKDFESDPLSI